MTRQKNMSLRTRLLLLATFIVLLGYALTLTLLSRQTSTMQHQTALQYTTQLATNEGAKATRKLEEGLNTARALAQALAWLSPTTIHQRAGLASDFTRSKVCASRLCLPPKRSSCFG